MNNNTIFSKKHLRWLVLLPILLFFQCEECPVCSPCESSEDISIYTLLDGSSIFQRMIVSRVMDNEYAGEIFINNLDVLVSGVQLDPKPNFTTFLDRRYFDYETDANYIGVASFSPGDSVFVQIFRNGTLSGQGYTQIPDSLNLIFDHTDALLKWREGAKGGGQVLNKPESREQTSSEVFTLDAYKRVGAGAYDTLLTNHFISGNSFALDDSLFQLRGFYRYKITAYDLNYYNHTFLDSTQAGLDLGYGMIGSKFSEFVDHFPPK